MAKNILFQGSPVIKVIRRINSSAMLATRSLGCVFLGSGERVALSKAPLQILLPSPRGNYGYRRHQEMTLRKIYASWDNASHSFRVELETEALAWQRCSERKM